MTRFQLGALEIDFAASQPESDLAQPTLPVAEPVAPAPAPQNPQPEPTRVQRAAPTEEELSLALIENPAEFERYAMREDLTDGDEGNDGSEE